MMPSSFFEGVVSVDVSLELLPCVMTPSRLRCGMSVRSKGCCIRDHGRKKAAVYRALYSFPRVPEGRGKLWIIGTAGRLFRSITQQCLKVDSSGMSGSVK